MEAHARVGAILAAQECSPTAAVDETAWWLLGIADRDGAMGTCLCGGQASGGAAAFAQVQVVLWGAGGRAPCVISVPHVQSAEGSYGGAGGRMRTTKCDGGDGSSAKMHKQGRRDGGDEVDDGWRRTRSGHGNAGRGDARASEVAV